MKNIDKNYIKSVVNSILHESIKVLSEDLDKLPTNYAKAYDQVRGEVSNYIVNKYQNGDEDVRDLMHKYARRSNINPDNLDSPDNSIKKMEKGSINDLRQYLISAVANLQKNVIPDNGNFTFEFKTKDDNDPYKTEVIRQKEFLDRLGLTFLYDLTFYPVPGGWGYGFTKENTPEDKLLTPEEAGRIFNPRIKPNTEGAKQGEVNTDQSIQAMSVQKLISRYMESKYGLDFSVPEFSDDNKKLKETLILNFASGHGCPAWNKCLVKHACYARASERSAGGDSTWQANEKRQFLWLTASSDPELEKLLFKYIRFATIKFPKLYKDLVKKGLYDGTLEELVATPFSEWGNELLQEVQQLNDNPKEKSTFKYKLVTQIRFNENGDFINQAILDMADRLAGDFKAVNITASAYTCRNLQFDKIKNILLTASQEGLNTDPGGDNAFQRIFLATPSVLYNTISPEKVWSVNGDELTIKPLASKWVSKKGDREEIHGIYKCPCDKDPFNQGYKIRCHQCNICYTPKKDNFDRFYVLVEVHGAQKKRFYRKPESIVVKSLGTPEDPEIKYLWQKHGWLPMNEDIESGTFDTPMEGINLDEGINCICNNAIWSMNEEVKSWQQITEAKNNFEKILENITKTK